MNSGTGIQVCDKVSLSGPGNNVDQSPGGAVIVSSPTPPIFLTFQLMERSAAFGSLLSGIGSFKMRQSLRTGNPDR